MTEIESKIPSYVKVLEKTLRQAGHQGYVVGGSLRDLLLSKTPHDFDMTTDATPEEMEEIFSAFRVIPTGLSHGTLTVLSEGHPVEITTHRVEGHYSDSRHPDAVSFRATLEEDLSRRDFTVNAMAYNEERGLVDLYGGEKDLQKGVLRAVGDPLLRFHEDALRILRCFRFAAQLDFSVEEKTLAAAAACREGLKEISAERIFSEYARTVTAKAAARGLALMEECGCLPYVFFDTVIGLSHLNLLEKLPADEAVRTAWLLSQKGKKAAEAWSKKLHTSNRFREDLLGYLSLVGETLPHDLYTARRFVCDHFPYFEKGILFLSLLRGEDGDEALSLARGVLRDRTAVEIRRLAVNGRELQEKAGVPPKKTAGVLAALQDAVLQDPARNKKEVLLSLAREMQR